MGRLSVELNHSPQENNHELGIQRPHGFLPSQLPRRIDFVQIVERRNYIDDRIPLPRLLVVGVRRENGRCNLDALLEKRRESRARKVHIYYLRLAGARSRPREGYRGAERYREGTPLHLPPLSKARNHPISA